MKARPAMFWLCLLGLAPTACALAGYDFGDYQRASTTDGGSATTRQTTANSAADAGSAQGGQTSPGGGGSEANASAGAPDDHPIGAEPTTFGAGGGPAIEASRDGGAAGAGAAAGNRGCVPTSCGEQAVECGSMDDGCGKELDCGGCFWWFLECREHTCQFTN